MSNNLQHIPPKLEGLRTEFRHTTDELVHRGMHKNLLITVYPARIYIRGSFSVFHFGTNLKTITREETAFGIQRLSDELHLDMSEAWISRLDVGTNLILERQLSEYTAFFGELLSYSKSAFGRGENKTITFDTTRRQLRFYDKIREQKSKGYKISDVFLGHNVCRYETSFLRPAQEFKVHKVTVDMLSEPNFFSNAVRKWDELYFKIPKIPRLKIIPEMRIRTKHDLNKIALVNLTQNRELYEAFMAEFNRSDLNKSQRARLKSKLRKSCNDRSITIPDTLITELDQKVREATRIYQS